MEEVVVLILQFVLEVVLQILGGAGLDWGTERHRERRRSRGEKVDSDGCGWLVLFAVVGGVCGGLSLVFAPNPLLPNAGLRLANLFVAPVLAGVASWLAAAYLWKSPDSGHHFWRGFVFALVFGIVRFAYLSR